MRRLFGLLLPACVLAAACGGGGGGGGGETPPPITTLYVRASGNDDSAGTSPDTALKSVARAAQFLAAGVTVYVGPGRYEGRVDIPNLKTTADRPVQLIADPDGLVTGDAPGEVVIDANEDLFAIRLSGAPFVTIDGFTLVGAQPIGSADGIVIQVRSGSSNAAIRNCVISAGGPADGIRVHSSNDVLIFNNLITDNNRGIRITDQSLGARVINNTIADNGNAGISISGSSQNAFVHNNIIQGNRNNVSISVDDTDPSSRVGYDGDFNLAFAPDLADQTKTYRPSVLRGGHDVNADAMFIDAGGGDYHLASDSPAVDAGNPAKIDPVLISEVLARSTAPDGTVDTPPVDLGYHYPAPQ
jgi:parallel beta-helix repeat protein